MFRLGVMWQICALKQNLVHAVPFTLYAERKSGSHRDYMLTTLSLLYELVDLVVLYLLHFHL